MDGLEWPVNRNVLWDTSAWTVNTSVSVRMVECVTDRMAGAPVQQAGWAHAVRWHVLKVYTAQAVSSSAGVIITPHVTTSLAPVCVLQAGEGCTARKFVYLAHMESDVLSDATVLAALPVTMLPGSVAAHLDLLVTAVSECVSQVRLD